MFKKFSFVFAFLAFTGFFLATGASEVSAQCTGSMTCGTSVNRVCTTSSGASCPGTSTPGCTCRDECAGGSVGASCGAYSPPASCNATGICEVYVGVCIKSGSCSLSSTPAPTAPPGGGNPTPPPGGGCSGSCFSGISNCGEVGRPNGTGSCPSGQLCCNAPGSGGDPAPPAPFGCAFTGMGIRNASNTAQTTFNVGDRLQFCFGIHEPQGLVTRTTATSNNAAIIQYNGQTVAPSGSYLPAWTTCQLPLGTAVGPGETNFFLRVYGRRCPACAEEVMCQGNTSARATVVGSTPPTVDLRANGSASAITIASGSRFTLSWSTANATSCTASGGWSGTQATSGSVQSGVMTSTTTYNLNCTGPGGNASDSITVNVQAAATPTPAPSAPSVDLRVNSSNGPISVSPGTNVTLSWTSTNASSCSASGAWSGSKSTSGSQGQTVNSTSTFNIGCTGPGGNATDSVTVNVAATTPAPTAPPGAPAVTLRVNGGTGTVTIQTNTSPTVSWTSTNVIANGCTAQASVSTTNWSGTKAASGSQAAGPINSGRTLAIQCRNSAGVTATSQVNVNVASAPTPTPAPNAPTVDIRANGSNGPITIASGTRFTLSWSSTNATSCSASGGWSGTQATSGSVQSGVMTSSTTYNIGCTGPGGNSTDSVTVNVGAATPAPTAAPGNPTVDLRVNGGSGTVTIQTNTSPTVSWTSTNVVANGCTAGASVATNNWSGTKAASGSQTAGPINSNRSIAIQCRNSAGVTVTSQVNVNVATAPTPTPAPNAPTVDIRANGSNGPITIASGTRFTLSWSSTNATSCSASGGWSGTQATSGSVQSGVMTSSTTYNIGCTGPGGNSTDSVTVNVGAATPAPTAAPGNPTVNLLVNGGSGTVTIQTNTSPTISWTSSNVVANGCTAGASVATNNWSGTKAASGSQTAGPINSARTLAIQCRNSAGVTVTSQVNVNVATAPTPTPAPNAPTVDIRANGSNGPITIASGTRFTLSWSSTNATSCTASGGWSGTQATSGSVQSGVMTSSTTYNIGCTGPGGNSTDSVTVNVGAATPAPTAAPGNPAVTLRVNGGTGTVTIQTNTSPTVSWTSTNVVANGCTAGASVATNNWSGTKAASGSQTAGPINSGRTLAIQCRNSAGVTVISQVNVNVASAPTPTPAPNAPTVDIRANGSNGPITIASGTRFTLSWSSTNATNCVASGGWSGNQATSGSIQSGVMTSSTTFNLGCTGPGGNSTDSVTVNVTAATPTPAPTPPPAAPVVDIRANGSNGPITIASGTRFTLSWASINATNCVASGGWSGNQATSGSVQSGVMTSTTTYNIGCTGPGGNSTDSVTVNVQAVPCAPPVPRDPPTTTCSLGGNPGTITWSWNAVTGATGYDVDILNASGGVVTAFPPRPAADFGCAGGGVCSLTTSHPAGVQVRSRIIAAGLTCSESPPAFSQFMQVPPCATCTVSLAPNPMQVIAGQSALMAANVTISPAGGTTVSQVAFASTNPAVVSVTSPDTTSPFTTNITGNSIGSATVHATASLANGGSCTTQPSNGANVTVISPNPWWQAVGGRVISGGVLRTPIPPTCVSPTCLAYLILNDPLGNRPSTAIYRSDYSFSADPLSRGSVSSSNQWLARTGTYPNIYTYQYFRNLSSGKPFSDLGANANIDSTAINQARAAGEGYLWLSASGNVTINQALNLNQKVVLFVNGNLNINGRIRFANINSNDNFFMVIVSGNINVSDTVTSANATDPALMGIFMANGTFSTGTNDVDDGRLVVAGSVAAGGVNLERELNDENVNTPAELFYFYPELVVNYPSALSVRHMVWREVAP